MINRLTAYKVWVSDLLNNNYIQTSGEFESNYVEFKDKQVSRVNLIATIIAKLESEDKNYVSVVLDDSSEQIKVKTWREDTRLLNNVSVGDVILVIGKIKKYNDEIYILPEIIKNLNINWELARKSELLKLYGKPQETKDTKEDEINKDKTIIEEIKFNSIDLKNEILNLIEKYEEKEGVSLEEIKSNISSDLNEINKILEELIKEGQVYSIGDKFRLLL